MAGHHRYAPVQPFQQNAFGALANKDNDEKLIAAMVATQVAALTSDVSKSIDADHLGQYHSAPRTTDGTDCGCPRHYA